MADRGVAGSPALSGGRLQLGQFAAIDTLLATLAVGQREFLLLQLLGIFQCRPPLYPPAAWVRGSGRQGPQWLVEQQVDGFLVQQPAYDFAARARQLLANGTGSSWPGRTTIASSWPRAASLKPSTTAVTPIWPCSSRRCWPCSIGSRFPLCNAGGRKRWPP
ncbi:hypothetical protein ACF2JD_18290 [Aeromonas sp. A-5]|uniref:hypothetical protein n=1 Tax=Aeromonas ichthyocola TaxID=3367746 RepID=UPI0038EE2AC5